MSADFAGEKTTYLQETYQLGINEREGYFSNSKINLLFGRKIQLWNHLGQEHGANSISPIIVWIELQTQRWQVAIMFQITSSLFIGKVETTV